MFTHSFALGISLSAIIIARKPPCHHKTFGLYRAEVLAAFINGLFLLPIVGIIIYEAILRIIYPQEILSLYMFIVAVIGLIVNIVSMVLLSGSRKSNLNIKSVFSHMLADSLSSIGIVVVAIIIFYTNLTILDALVSIGISLIILYWAFGILRASARILLEMAPKGLDIESLNDNLKKQFNEIIDLFNVHLWTITPDMLIFSAHIVVSNKNDVLSNQDSFLTKVNDYLFEKYRIIESTVQIISENEARACRIIP
jgi:cobalt-zinc-cadmium efflux system protein